jgi:hypothetical protein
VDAQFLETRVKKRCRTCDSDIACHCQVEAGPDGRAVDSGDRGQRAIGHGEKAVVDCPQAALRRIAEGAEVRARTEGLARAGHHHRVNTGVGFHLVYGRAQSCRDVGGQRIAPVRIVDSDQRDAFLRADQNGFGHRPTLASTVARDIPLRPRER